MFVGSVCVCLWGPYVCMRVCERETERERERERERGGGVCMGVYGCVAAVVED